MTEIVSAVGFRSSASLFVFHLCLTVFAFSIIFAFGMEEPVAATDACMEPDELMDSGDEEQIDPSWYDEPKQYCKVCATFMATAATCQALCLTISDSGHTYKLWIDQFPLNTSRVPPGTDGSIDDSLFADEVIFLRMKFAACVLLWMHVRTGYPLFTSYYVLIYYDLSVRDYRFIFSPSHFFFFSFSIVSTTFLCGAKTSG